jgi:hypothetical protein
VRSAPPSGRSRRCAARRLARHLRQPLAARGNIQDWIAESRIEIEMARLLTLKAAWLMDTVGNRHARTEIAAIKVAAPNVALKVLDRAIQVHGGGGVSDDFPLAWAYAHLRTLRLADGPDEVHKLSIARRELAPYIKRRDLRQMCDRQSEVKPGRASHGDGIPGVIDTRAENARDISRGRDTDHSPEVAAMPWVLEQDQRGHSIAGQEREWITDAPVSDADDTSVRLVGAELLEHLPRDDLGTSFDLRGQVGGKGSHELLQMITISRHDDVNSRSKAQRVLERMETLQYHKVVLVAGIVEPLGQTSRIFAQVLRAHPCSLFLRAGRQVARRPQSECWSALYVHPLARSVCSAALRGPTLRR